MDINKNATPAENDSPCMIGDMEFVVSDPDFPAEALQPDPPVSPSDTECPVSDEAGTAENTDIAPPEKHNIFSGIKETAVRGADALKTTAGGIADAAGTAADKVQQTALDLAEKARQDKIRSQLKKYSPVFPDEYDRADFSLPNLIVIADDSVRKDIPVCQGSIGWTSTEKGIDVLHLYDTAVPSSGLNFVPAPTCDTAYYVDPYNKNRFISLESLYDKMQQSKLAELCEVATCLGAKRYSVELADDSRSVAVSKHRGNAKARGMLKKADISKSGTSENVKTSSSKSLAYAEFSSSRQPAMPDLNWFKHDDNIANLVETVCSGTSNMKSYTIEISGSECATMSSSTAAKIDGAVAKMGLNSTVDMQSQASNERSHKLVFHIEF